MEDFFEYLRVQNERLLCEADELKASDRIDECNLTKVRANIYDVCATVCRVHMNRPGGGLEACREQFDRFRNVWGSEKKRNEAHGDVTKAVIEEIKLEALEDIAARFEETVK